MHFTSNYKVNPIHYNSFLIKKKIENSDFSSKNHKGFHQCFPFFIKDCLGIKEGKIITKSIIEACKIKDFNFIDSFCLVNYLRQEFDLDN